MEGKAAALSVGAVVAIGGAAAWHFAASRRRRKEAAAIGILGDVFVDIIVRTADDRLPSWGGDVLTEEPIVMAAGGSALNTAVHAAERGLAVKLFSAVGHDPWASVARGRLAEAGVELREPAALAAMPTGSCLVLAGPSDRCFVTYRGGAGMMESRHFDAGELARCPHLHVAGYYNLTVLRRGLGGLLREAKSRGRRGGPSVSLTPQYDADGKWDGLDDLYPVVDVLIANEVEATAIVEAAGRAFRGARDAALFFLDRGVGLVVLTMGARGAFAMGRAPGDGRRFFAVEQPAAPIELVDATGAGDAFGAGFLAAWTAAPRRAGDVEALVAALEEGVAHGTAACRQVGASAALDAAALGSARAFSRGAAEVTHYARNGGGEGDGLVEVPAARPPLP